MVGLWFPTASEYGQEFIMIQGGLSSNYERGRLDEVQYTQSFWHLGFSTSLAFWGCILQLSVRGKKCTWLG